MQRFNSDVGNVIVVSVLGRDRQLFNECGLISPRLGFNATAAPTNGLNASGYC